MMENSTDGDDPKSKPPADNNPASTSTSYVGNGEKGGIELELKEILKDNLNHSFVSALVCLIIIVLIRDGFFTICFVGFCCAAIVNAIWSRRVDSDRGREFIDSCKKTDVAYFLTLHYFTYERTRKVLQRIEREAETIKSTV